MMPFQIATLLLILFSKQCLLVNSVPVLLLKTTDFKHAEKISGMLTIKADELKRILSVQISEKQFIPKIIVFLENDLSIEDFSWHDNMNLGNFPRLEDAVETVLYSEYFPSVLSPLEAIHGLVEFGYVIKYRKGNDLTPLPDHVKDLWIIKLASIKDRTKSLRKHDEIIVKTFRKLSRKYNNLLVVYTGIRSPWEIENRYNFNGDSISSLKSVAKENRTLVLQNKRVLLVSKINPVLKHKKFGKIKLAEYPFGKTYLLSGENETRLKVKYDSDHKLMFTYNFSVSSGYWKLKSIDFNINSEETENLCPLFDISAPFGMSWHSNLEVLFVSKSSADSRLYFNDLQVQLFSTQELNSTFGPAVDVISFFTVVIWETIFVVFLLLAVLLWGILMLMDVKTCDQYDNVKTQPLVVNSAD